MPVREISQDKFNSVLQTRPPFGHQLSEERAWFALAGDEVVGMVLFDAAVRTWEYVVLSRQADSGRFEPVDGNVGRNQLHTTDLLKNAMRRCAKLPER